jgi:hypothetical protein
MDNFFSKAYADTLYVGLASVNELIDDEVATLLQAGTDVTVAYNDAANTLTVGLGGNVPRLNAASNAFTGAVAANTLSAGSTGQTTINASGQLAVGGTQTTFGPPGSGRSFINTSAGFSLGSAMVIGFSSNADAGLAGLDATARRNATGPAWEFRSAGGVRVCSIDGTAFTLLACGSIRLGTGATVQAILSATATLDFASIAASSFADLTITVTGAVSGDTVIVNPIAGSATTDVVYTGWVSAANTVTIRASNVSSTTARDPASGTFRATVIRF